MKLADLMWERGSLEESMDRNAQNLTDLLFPVFRAAGCDIATDSREWFEDVSIQKPYVVLVTSSWVGGSEETHYYSLPLSVIEAPDPVAAAEQFKQEELAAEKEKRRQQCLSEIAALEQKLKMLKGQHDQD